MRPSTVSTTRWSLLGLICLGLLLSLSFQGARGLWSPDEGRYTVAALQMLDSGDYLAPAYSPDEVNFSKPPATYWLIAASFKLFGRTTWAARAPCTLAFVLTLLVLYAIGRQLIPDKPWLPAVMYGCALVPFATSNIISTDVLLTLCEAFAMLGFLRAAFDEAEQHRKRYAVLMWIGWGLAFLTKGPPGVLPMAAVVPFIAGRDGWRGLRRFFPLSGLLLFLVIGSSWYVVVMLRYPGLAHYFLHQEVYDRVFTSAQRRHAGWWGWAKIYIPTLALGVLPWWPSALRILRCGVSIKQWKTQKGSQPVELFLAMWFLLPLVVFCLAQSRLPLYMAPLFLPISLLLALDLRDRIDLRRTPQQLAMAVWIAALLALKVDVAYHEYPDLDNRKAANELTAMAPAASYQAVIFVENTALAYNVEEGTPWGLRLYLGRTVYGIPWLAPQSTAALCHALHRHGSALVVVDPYLDPQSLALELARCSPRQIDTVGTWRHRALLRVQVDP